MTFSRGGVGNFAAFHFEKEFTYLQIFGAAISKGVALKICEKGLPFQFAWGDSLIFLEVLL